MRSLVRWSVVFLAACLVMFVAESVSAQTSGTVNPQPGSGTTQGEQPPPDRPASGVFIGREPNNPAPAVEGEPGILTSFAEGFLRGARQNVGVSVSIWESYSPNINNTPTGRTGSAFTSFQPSLILNYEKRRFNFRSNYSFSMTHYNDSSESFRRWSHNGFASVGYTIARRRSTLQLSEQVASFFYDPATSLISSATGLVRTDLPGQIYLDRRRETRSAASANWTYTFTPRFTTNLSGNHSYTKYSGQGVEGRNLFFAGFGTSYRITSWLSFGANYSHYLNSPDEAFRAQNIEELEAGSFTVRAGGGWVLAFSGGVESTSEIGIRRYTGSGRAGLSRTSGRSTIGLNYHHGYTTISHSAEVWSGDTLDLNFVQALSRQIRFFANAAYIRGSAVGTHSLNDGLHSTAGLEFAVQRNLILSTHYSYASQQLGNLSFGSANLHRTSVSAGLQYFIPSFAAR